MSSGNDFGMGFDTGSRFEPSASSSSIGELTRMLYDDTDMFFPGFAAHSNPLLSSTAGLQYFGSDRVASVDGNGGGASHTVKRRGSWDVDDDGEPAKLFQGWMEYDYAAFQQYALAPEVFVAKLPPSLSTLEASSIPTAVVTAAVGFSHPGSAIPSITDAGQRLKSFFDGRGGAGVKPFWEDDAEGVKVGEPIVILGGSSSVGQLVIQIAKHLGYSPVITTSSLKHTDRLKSLGATHVLDRSTPEASLVSDIQAIAHNKPIELVYDAVGAITQAQIDLLAPGGAFVLADPGILGPKLDFNDGRRLLVCGGVVHGFKEFGASLFEKLESLLERGVIKPLRVEKLPGGLSGILDGLARLQRNEVSGVKLVVDPSET
ncbi:hypothetical protein PQX77_005346 [Marasmius sp. AFHP31]|nr:hypothetical protein PQX77_005346 [Marasmius sp. AFHP31]